MGVFHFERILYCPRLFLSINIFSMEPNKMLELHFSVVFLSFFIFRNIQFTFGVGLTLFLLCTKCSFYDDVQKHFFQTKKSNCISKNSGVAIRKPIFMFNVDIFVVFSSLTKYIFGNTKFCIQNLIAQKT